MFTIDASVWVNSFDEREPGHAISRQLLNLLAEQDVSIVVPHLLLVEVAGAISRTRQNPSQAQSFATALSQLPNVRYVVLDEKLAMRALTLASQHGLRGADAVYAAVVMESGGTLVSLDNEHLTRLQSVLAVRTPADVLPDLLTSESLGMPEHE